MRVFVVLTGFLLTSLSLASNADQTRSEQANMLAILSTVESAHEQVTELMEVHRFYLAAVLNAIGAEQKTAAEWRAQWMSEGKTERITRYLTGRHDNARLWYLSASKANADSMAGFGLGDVRIGYIEHWHWFNRLVDAHNAVSKAIFKKKLEHMKKDIKEMRKRLAQANCDLDAMRKQVSGMRTTVQASRDAVSRMAHRVEAQNLGLQFVLAFQRGLLQGLNKLNEADEELGNL